MGYGGIILHGVYAYNRVAHQLLRELGQSQPENIKEFEAKFSGPVKPGDRIHVDLWRLGVDSNGWEEILWTAKVEESGKFCMSDGRAMIRVEDAKGFSKL
jgi:peroxisomal enoyl-CoA hydratase 2